MNSQERSTSEGPQQTGSEEATLNLSSTHVTHVREDVAVAGACGNVHLPTGRTCTLPVRHPGSCDFVAPEDAENLAAR